MERSRTRKWVLASGKHSWHAIRASLSTSCTANWRALYGARLAATFLLPLILTWLCHCQSVGQTTSTSCSFRTRFTKPSKLTKTSRTKTLGSQARPASSILPWKLKWLLRWRYWISKIKWLKEQSTFARQDCGRRIWYFVSVRRERSTMSTKMMIRSTPSIPRDTLKKSIS